ncbi:MAG TPA: HEAT repeat domain-containing protein, partial [Casimicrobiaceae bacterium]|nr:HEAT repeat domain-containing protein [Casimicrobiaceae bacterium]
MLLLAAVAAQAQEPARMQAVQSLSSSDPQARRSAAARLSEVGTTADVPVLVRALRDPDQDARGEAEQAIWHIWSRSGDPEVDKLYETGIEQMNA